MIEIGISDACLSRLRVAWNPLAEIFASAALLARYRQNLQFPYRSWMMHAGRATAEGDGVAMLAWAGRWPLGCLPWFLLSEMDDNPPRELDDLLVGLGKASPERVRSRLLADYPAGVPEAFAEFAATPAAALAELVDMAKDYASAVLRPYWPVICDTAEGEILRCGQAFTTRGVDGLLADLPARIRWTRPALALNAAAAPDRPLVSPQQLRLIPLVFLRDQVLMYQFGETLCVAYQSSGAANLALPGRQVAPPDDGLTMLLGRSRATLLLSLQRPSTTTALAARLELAASTVSEHLATLRSAEIVERRRRGNRVYYALTDRGKDLLALFGEAGS